MQMLTTVYIHKEKDAYKIANDPADDEFFA